MYCKLTGYVIVNLLKFRLDLAYFIIIILNAVIILYVFIVFIKYYSVREPNLVFISTVNK